jgi:hypothetical protein
VLLRAGRGRSVVSLSLCMGWGEDPEEVSWIGAPNR